MGSLSIEHCRFIHSCLQYLLSLWARLQRRSTQMHLYVHTHTYIAVEGIDKVAMVTACTMSEKKKNLYKIGTYEWKCEHTQMAPTDRQGPQTDRAHRHTGPTDRHSYVSHLRIKYPWLCNILIQLYAKKCSRCCCSNLLWDILYRSGFNLVAEEHSLSIIFSNRRWKWKHIPRCLTLSQAALKKEKEKIHNSKWDAD